jgi:hypothetical protein
MKEGNGTMNTKKFSLLEFSFTLEKQKSLKVPYNYNLVARQKDRSSHKVCMELERL